MSLELLSILPQFKVQYIRFNVYYLLKLFCFEREKNVTFEYKYCLHLEGCIENIVSYFDIVSPPLSLPNKRQPYMFILPFLHISMAQSVSVFLGPHGEL